MTKIMYKWITLEDFEEVQIQWDYLVDGVETIKNFCYKQKFGTHYKLRYQVGDSNNIRHSLILVEKTWDKMFWEDGKCAWYIETREVNTNIAWVNF